MVTMNINFVSEPGPDTQATVDVFAPNAPGGTEMPGLATTSMPDALVFLNQLHVFLRF